MLQLLLDPFPSHGPATGRTIAPGHWRRLSFSADDGGLPVNGGTDPRAPRTQQGDHRHETLTRASVSLFIRPAMPFCDTPLSHAQGRQPSKEIRSRAALDHRARRAV